jgi:hypothetical protein
MQGSGWNQDGDGLGWADAFAVGLGERRGLGLQAGSVAPWPADGEPIGEKRGLEERAGLGSGARPAGRCGLGDGWLLADGIWRAEGSPAGDVADGCGPEPGGAGAATVTCASCWMGLGSWSV